MFVTSIPNDELDILIKEWEALGGYAMRFDPSEGWYGTVIFWKGGASVAEYKCKPGEDWIKLWERSSLIE